MTEEQPQNVQWFDLKKAFPLAAGAELQNGEYRRGPNIRLVEPESHVGEVYEAAPLPRMVSYPPRGEGLYYVRIPGFPIRVVDVYRRGHLWFASWSDIPEFEVSKSGYEFSDRPLPDPMET